MTSLQRLVRQHAALGYFALTFAISWGGALLALGPSGGMSGSAPTADPRFMYAVAAMLAGPSISGILFTALVEGKAGLREFLSRATRWRVSVRWHAVALFTAPVLWLGTMLVLASASPTFLPAIVSSTEKGHLVLVGLGVGVVVGIFEELGWTGFAIPRFRRHHGVFATGLMVGVPWGAWHVLTNVVWASNVTTGDLPLRIFLPVSVFASLVGYLAAFRILMVWVYDSTESLLLAMVMHASLTATVLIVEPAGVTGAAMLTYAFALAASVWTTVAAVAARSGWHVGRRAHGHASAAG